MNNYLLILLLLSGIFTSCASGDQKQSEPEYVDDIREFLKIASFEKMDECFPDKQSFPQAALLKKSIDIEYKFSDDCNYKGKFVASYLDEIPMQLQLKEIGEYQKASALIKLHIHQHRNGVYYGFEVKEGALIGKGKQVPFTVRYKVDTDPLTNEIKEGTEKGEIHIITPGTKKVKATYPFSFH